MSTHKIIERFNDVCAHKASQKKALKKLRIKKIRLVKDIKALEIVRYINTEAGKIAQKQMKKKIESLVTIAIRGVFDRPFTFKLIFEQKRNHIEATPLILEGKNEYNPKGDLGGGVTDIVSFALRLVLWHLSNPKSINFFILDEPFRLTGALIERVGKVLKYLSKELNFRVLLISHDNNLIEICDKVYRVTHNGIESALKLIKGRKIKRRN